MGLTITTLQDIDYIRKYYTIEFDQTSAIDTIGGRDDSGRVAKAEKGFNP